MGATKQAPPPTARPPRSKTPEEREATRESVAWFALAKFGEKQADRALLEAGREHDVKLDVAGHVDGRWVYFEVRGALRVGHDQPSSRTSTPDADHVTALLLAAVPKTRRRELLAAIAEHYLEHKTLPPVDEGLLSQASTWLAGLRDKETHTRKGNVKFEQRRSP